MTWRGVSVFADIAGGKLGALLAGSCSAASPSSYYLLRVPGISSLKQGHQQESHTYFFVPHPRVQQHGKGWWYFFLIARYGLADTTENLPALHGGWSRVRSAMLFCLHGSILHFQNHSAQLIASSAC